MTMYKIIVHLEYTAYVFEYVDDLALGIKKCKEYWNIIHNTDAPLNFILSYPLIEEEIYREDCVFGKTNGVNSIYLLN